LKLTEVQERTKQEEFKAKVAQNEAYKEQTRLERVQREAEESRRTLDRKHELDKQREQYRDELERKRLMDQMNVNRQMQEEERQKQEDMVARQEAIRRKTLEYEAELREKTEKARVLAETEGRILQERKNHDLIIEKAKVEAREFRETVMDGIQAAGKTVGEGLREFLTDRERMQNAVGMLVGLALGVYGAKVGVNLVGKVVESRIGKPSLVRETSRLTLSELRSQPWATVKKVFGMRGEDALKNMVLEKSLRTALTQIQRSTLNVKRNRANFQNLLLHGPPGTGKTMFARNLARSSGMDFAIMTGGDIAPLGKDAVTQIHKLFDWANTSRKGLVLFVDESDAFLQQRSSERMGEEMRNALNAFLYHTGTQSDKFMLILASNLPHQLDRAVLDRTDSLLDFDLPSPHALQHLLFMYYEKYIVEQSSRIQTEDDFTGRFGQLAHDLTGFSAREIEKLCLGFQAAAFGSTDARLTDQLFTQVVQQHVAQKRQKDAWWQTNPEKVRAELAHMVFQGEEGEEEK
jgi:ATPase family AAA domain-containing protein 3A/B